MAGVSPATVSRVLNNPEYHCADPKKREKIWEAAMKLNYVPNEAARSLKKGKTISQDKTYYIHVLMTRMEQGQPDPFFAELLRIVESEIHKNGCILSKVWYMSVFFHDKKCRLSQLNQIIDDLYEETDGKSDGLIVIGRCNKEALKKLKNKFRNVVSVTRNSTHNEVDEVTCDGNKIAQTAVEHLLSLGHRDIGYVGDCHDESRYMGYLDTLKNNEIQPVSEYIMESKQTEAAGFEAMEKILASGNIPTGIYCANDIVAIGMLKALAKVRKRYIAISIISSDNIEQAQFSNPMLTTVALPKKEMGKFAVYLLLDRIAGNHSATVSMKVEGELIKRSSCMNVNDGIWSDYSI